MPRNGSGTYTLPTGNPVSPGTTIESAWANSTLSDIGTELTNSLSRTGAGGMLAAFRLADGTQAAPGLAFLNETGTGLYRAGSGEMWANVQGLQIQQFTVNGVLIPTGKTFTAQGASTFSGALSYTGTLTGGTGVVNLGSGQFYKDASGNVGIGTSSPGAKLDVSVTRIYGQSADIGIALGGTDNGYVDTGAASSWRQYVAGSNTGQALRFDAFLRGTGWTERMRLDSSGNLGLGVTPSAWNSASLAFQVSTAATFWGLNNNQAYVGSNSFYDAVGNFKYIVSDSATQYRQWQGAHTWFTAPSGTAGNAITFTQAMTLDASGNLLVGETSAKYSAANRGLIEVNGTTSALLGLSVNNTAAGYLYSTSTDLYVGAPTGYNILFDINGEKMRLDSSGNLGLGTTPSDWSVGSGRVLQVNAAGYYGDSTQAIVSSNGYYNTSWKYVNTAPASRYEQSSGVHNWYTAGSGTAGNAISFTQAMTLTADGRLGIGVTNPAYTFVTAFDAAVTAGSCTTLLSAEGGAQGSVGTTTNHALLLKTNNTERAQITSGGDLLVGTTSSSGRVTVNGNAGGANSVVALQTVSGGYCFIADAVNNGGTYYHAQFKQAATPVGSITSTGSTTAYNTTSDQRLKTNIVDAPDAAALIDSIKVRSFDWIADDSHQRYGMVAQELFEVAPEAVHAPADPDEMMAVDYSKLVPMLIKEVQSLRARVAALEA